MIMEQVVFYSLAAVILIPALLVVLLRNAVHSALFLGLSLAGVAGIFALLGADLLFGGQILVYVTGIAVLIMFCVMLLGRTSDLHLRQTNRQWAAGLLLCAISGMGLYHVARAYSKTASQTAAAPTTHGIAGLMLGDYAVPFELISIVLLAALLGAVFFSRVETKDANDAPGGAQ